MNLPLIGAAAVILVIVLAQVIVSNQFAGSIEGLRRAAVNEQLPTSSDHQVLPEIMRAFAVRNGATIGGPMAILAHQSAEMRLGPIRPTLPSRRPSCPAPASPHLSGTRGG